MIASEGLGGAMQTIVAAAQKSGMSLQSFIGQVEGQTIALALAGAQADVFDEKLKQMGETAGATDAAYAAQTEGINKLGHSYEQLKQAGTVALQEIGDAMGEALDKETVTQLSGAITDLIKAFGALSPETKQNMIKFAAFAAAIGPVISILGKVGAALKWVATAASTLGAALTGVLAAGIALIVGSLGYLHDVAIAENKSMWATWRDGWHMLWQDISQTMERIVATVVQGFKRIINGANDFGARIISAIAGPFGKMKDLARQATDFVADKFKSLYDRVVGHSYIPDMVEDVKKWMLRLGSDALVDPATAATAEGAEAFKRMNDSIKGTISDLGKELELIQSKHQVWGDAVDVNAESANALEQAINSLLQNGMEPADPVIVELTAQHHALAAAMNAAEAAANRLDAALGDNADGLADTLASIDAMNEGLGRLMDKFKTAAFEQAVFGNGAYTLKDKIADVRDEIMKLSSAGFDANSSEVQRLKTLYDKLTAELAANEKQAMQVAAAYSLMTGILNSCAEGVDALRTRTNASMAAVATSAANAVRSAGADFNSLWDTANDTFTEMENSAFDWKGTMLGIFGSVLSGGQSIFGALSYAAASYFGIPLQFAGMIEPALGAIWDGVSWVGETLWSGITSVVDAINPLNWFADGGTMQSRGTAVVGERGPEILNLNAGDTITPLNKIGGTGGGAMNIVLNIDGRTIAQTATKYMPGVLKLQGVSR
jgi:hypothetical protein